MPITRILALSVALVLTFALAAGVAAQAGPVGVGEPATYVSADGLKGGTVTVTEVLDPYTGFPEDRAPEPGTKYVVVTLAFEGTGEDGIDASYQGVWLRDATGVLWSANSPSGILDDFPQPALDITTVGPGSRISGYVSYGLPDDVVIQDVVVRADSGVLLLLADAGGARPEVGTPVTITNAEGATVIANVKEVEDPYKQFDKDSPPADGGRFVMVTASFENTGDAKFDFETGGAVLRDANGAMWAPTSITPAKKPKTPELKSNALGPGNLVTGRLGYQVPADVALDGLYYQGSGRLFRLADLSGSVAEPPGGGPTPSAAPASATGSFGPAGSLAEERSSHTETLLPDGRVLVVGGETATADGGIITSSAAELWDPATGSFGPAGSLAEARSSHTETLLPDGRVLVVGGGLFTAGDDVPLASAELWDPASGSFGPAGPLAEARSSHTATLLPDGRVLVIGGDGDDFIPLASAELWDPATGSFGPAGSLAEARSSHTETLLPDGRVLVVGGLVFADGYVPVASAELWDPATGSFGPAGSLTDARYSHTATLLPDGRVLVVGGIADDFIRLASAELWDPATGSFGPAGPLAEARSSHTATLLPDDRVLVVGGDGDDDILASAELWDPATGSFGPAGPLAEARSSHTATLLPDDRVLVVGGSAIVPDAKFGSVVVPLASAELYDPGA